MDCEPHSMVSSDMSRGIESLLTKHDFSQAITVKGFGGGPDKKEVYDYFKEFSPVSMELVDGNTINVVWALPASAAKAMLRD